MSHTPEGNNDGVGGPKKARADVSFFGPMARPAKLGETTGTPKPVSVLRGNGELFSGGLSARLAAVFRYLGIPIENVRFERLLTQVKRVSAGTDSDFVPLLVAAADSKGLRLGDDALFGLSSLLDGYSGKNKHEPGTGSGEENHAENKDPDQQEGLLPDSVDPRSIRTVFEASLDRNDALSFMNRTKNAESRRWMALPLLMKHESVEFRACLRLLLHESGTALDPVVEGLVLDVAAPARTWSFVIAGEYREGSILSVYAEPSLGESAAEIERLLREAMEPTGLRVSVSGVGTPFGVEGRIEGYSAVDVEA